MPLGRLQTLFYKAWIKNNSEEGKKQIAEEQVIETISEIAGG